MLNAIETYENCGYVAVRALHRFKDYGRWDHEMRWYRRALALESAEDRKLAEQAFNKGYREGR